MEPRFYVHTAKVREFFKYDVRDRRPDGGEAVTPRIVARCPTERDAATIARALNREAER